MNDDCFINNMSKSLLQSGYRSLLSPFLPLVMLPHVWASLRRLNSTPIFPQTRLVSSEEWPQQRPQQAFRWGIAVIRSVDTRNHSFNNKMVEITLNVLRQWSAESRPFIRTRRHLRSFSISILWWRRRWLQQLCQISMPSRMDIANISVTANGMRGMLTILISGNLPLPSRCVFGKKNYALSYISCHIRHTVTYSTHIPILLASPQDSLFLYFNWLTSPYLCLA